MTYCLCLWLHILLKIKLLSLDSVNEIQSLLNSNREFGHISIPTK